MTISSSQITVDLDNYSRPIDLDRLFGRSAAVHLEVGSGKGTFLLNQARAHPQCNFLGIEWAGKYYRYSVDRMRRWQMSNVRILRTDARHFIGHCLPDAAIHTFHVYFPDPWPKKRHHKRRFFTPPNILQVARCLAPVGQLRTATDHADYFQIIRELLLTAPSIASLFEPVDFFPADSAQAGEWVGSNFERKYLKEGRKIYTLAIQKL